MRDPNRFLALLTPHRPKLVLVSRSLLRRKADADDAVQEATLSAWRDFARYREGASFGAWVLGYLVNTIRNWNRLLREELEVPLPPEAEDPKQVLEWQEAYEAFFREPEAVLQTVEQSLAEAIFSLSEAERLVLLLRSVGGLSYREISEVMGIPQGTAMSHLSRARKRVRVRLSAGAPRGDGAERRDQP
ncbi:MAG: RNA polymerase sigma factor [Planctomycetota bacterium]